MSDILKSTLDLLRQVDGFIAASLVEIETGMTVESTRAGQEFDIEVAGAINTTVVQAKLRALEALQLADDLEDIVISMGAQYHLMRIAPGRPTHFLYMVLNRNLANLAMARLEMARVSDELEGQTRTPRAAPKYPRAQPKKRSNSKLARLKRRSDSLPRGFPRGRGSRS